MLDFETIYSYGEAGKFVNTVIEIPLGSINKIEYSRETKAFYLDRVEPSVFPKPTNYGFIPQTTDEDGDPLDTLIVTSEPLSTGLVVRARVIGLLDFVDDGENDHKIICVPEDDRNTGDSIKSLSDLSDQWKKQVEFHFSHYKDLKKPGTTVVKGWGDEAIAWEIITECSNRYKKSS